MLAEAQKDIYADLGEFYSSSLTMARIYGQYFPELSTLMPGLFNFSIAPVSYSNSSNFSADHFSAFSETLWDLFPIIVNATYKLGDVKAYRLYLETL
jgi:hypothetical protein